MDTVPIVLAPNFHQVHADNQELSELKTFFYKGVCLYDRTTCCLKSAIYIIHHKIILGIIVSRHQQYSQCLI